MTGTLGLFSLVDLFQLLSASSRSGRLSIDHPRGKARVYFDQGRVVHAEFNDLRGEQAVYALFNDEQGSFEFMLGVPAPDSTIQTKTESLVLEASRRLDESRRAGDRALSPEAVPSFAPTGTHYGNLSLSGPEVNLLRLVDGRRTVGQIAQRLEVELEAIRRVVQRLVEAGILRLSGRRPRTARLVTRLAANDLPPGTGGIDASILASWEKAMGQAVSTVACRLPDERVFTLTATGIPDAGPFLLLSRGTLLRTDLVVNQALLVRPVPTKTGASSEPKGKGAAQVDGGE